MSTITISQSKSKVNTNIKIAIDDCRIISASVRDWISRCPYFCSPALIRFGTKIRSLQLSRLTVSSPTALSIPQKFVPHFRGPHSPHRLPLGFKSPQNKEKDIFVSFLYDFELSYK